MTENDSKDFTLGCLTGKLDSLAQSVDRLATTQKDIADKIDKIQDGTERKINELEKKVTKFWVYSTGFGAGAGTIISLIAWLIQQGYLK